MAIVSSARWALVHELKEEPEPSLDAVIARLGASDLVLVEGYKSAPIPKIEVRRTAAVSQAPLAARDPNYVAVASDHAVAGSGLPVFPLDDIAGIADFISSALALRRPA